MLLLDLKKFFPYAPHSIIYQRHQRYIPVSYTHLALPSDLRAVMKSCTKYTDNKGGGNTASNVSSTTDYLCLIVRLRIIAILVRCKNLILGQQEQIIRGRDVYKRQQANRPFL